MKLRKLFCSLSATLALSAGAVTVAQAQTPEQAPLPLNRFNPNFAGDRFFGVNSPHALGHPGVHVMLMGDYAHNPLVLRREFADGTDETIGSIVKNQLHLHLNGTFALWNRIALNVEIPLAVYQDGDDPSPPGSSAFASPSGVDFGDLRVGLRGRIYGEYHDPFQIAIGANLWIPTGKSEVGHFVGNGDFRALPHVIIGGEIDRFIYAVDVGPDIRSSQDYGNVGQGTMLSYGVGLGGLLDEQRKLQLGVDILGAVVFRDIQERTTNLEVLAGVKWRFIDEMVLGVAAGPGLTGGIGTPDFRGVFSITYTPEPVLEVDTDGDGILDEDDACPTVAGIPSEDPEKHGCPAVAPPPDTDGDGIIDAEDACPQVAGVPNEDKAKHGCPPPPDTDGDGIIDAEDACPKVAGIPNDDKTKHGCPPPGDKDGDGIIDEEDACPDVKGIPNADKSKHGCPPPPDTDGDGIIDPLDACPKLAGIPHKDPKKNGCPKVVVKGKEIIILERVEFALNKAIIRPVSATLLDEIAKIFKENSFIKLVEVQGHTDKRGSRAYNKQLSQRRAQAVVNALVKRGIARKRMVAKGYGPDKLVDKADTEEAHQTNRRVQFVILKQDPKADVEVKNKAVNK